MESAIRRLRQERAILTARQGDAQLPASGTLLARRNRLRAELDQADDQRAEAHAHDAQQYSVFVFGARTPAAIQRDIRQVEEEISSLQRKVASIDSILAREEGGPTPKSNQRVAMSLDSVAK